MRATYLFTYLTDEGGHRRGESLSVTGESQIDATCQLLIHKGFLKERDKSYMTWHGLRELFRALAERDNFLMVTIVNVDIMAPVYNYIKV